MEYTSNAALEETPFSLARVLQAIEKMKQPVIHAKETKLWEGKGMKVEVSPYMPDGHAWIIQDGKLLGTMKEKDGMWEGRVFENPLSLTYPLPAPTAEAGGE